MLSVDVLSVIGIVSSLPGTPETSGHHRGVATAYMPSRAMLYSQATAAGLADLLERPICAASALLAWLPEHLVTFARACRRRLARHADRTSRELAPSRSLFPADPASSPMPPDPVRNALPAEPLVLANLLSSTNDVAARLLRTLADRQWLDAYLLSAGLVQILEDYLHPDPFLLRRAASYLVTSPSAAFRVAGKLSSVTAALICPVMFVGARRHLLAVCRELTQVRSVLAETVMDSWSGTNLIRSR